MSLVLAVAGVGVGSVGGCDSNGSLVAPAGDAAADAADATKHDAAPDGGGGTVPCSADAGTGSVGVVGCACSHAGQLACNGNAQKLTLVCENHVWAVGQICPVGDNCVSTPGPNQGTCAAIDAFCAGASPGQEVCNSATSITRCGADLVNDNPVHACSGSTPSCASGACTCLGKVCGSACVDTSNDPNNCGSCGNACDGGGCQSGMCRSLIGVETGQGGPSAVTVDANNVYWLDFGAGTVMQAPVTGGAATTLASGQNSPQGIAVDGSNVYWTNKGTDTCVGDAGSCTYNQDGAVMQVPIGGGTAITLATSQQFPVGITVSSWMVYWADFGAGTIMGTPIGGGGPLLTLATGQAAPWDVIADAQTESIYWVNRGTSANLLTDGTVVRMTPFPLQLPDSGVTTLMATGQADPTSITLDQNFLYWVNVGTQANGYNDGTVVRLPLVGGTPSLLATGQKGPSSIAVDATHAYWVNYLGGTLAYVPLAGGFPAALATGQKFPQTLPDSLTVFASKLYWANQGGGGSILSTATP